MSLLTNLEASVVHSLVTGLQDADQRRGREEAYPPHASLEERAIRRVAASFDLTANTVADVVAARSAS